VSDTSLSPQAGRIRQALNPVTAYLLGGGFVAFALALAAPITSFEGISFGLIIALVALYWFAFNTEFVSWGGSAVPTQPVLIGLLFLVPIRLVPLCVLLGVAMPWPFGQPRAEREGVPSVRRAAIKALGGWHAAGPVIVLLVADARPAEFEHWPVYLLAFGAQYAIEIFVATVRLYALRLPIRLLLRPMSWTFAIDLMLAPLALAAIVSEASSLGELILLASPVGLMRVLATDRQVQIDSTASARSEARIDSLTGLSNRRAWYEALAEMRAVADDSDVITIVMADLDRLKVANDTLGHQVGDALITRMAQVLRECAPNDAVVARLGGDEYGVAVLRPYGESTALNLIADIRRAVDATPPISGFTLSASLGAASCPPAADIAQAEREADREAGIDKRIRKMGRSTD
jgi:diguanylate cyclase (GGDEF)-like protein